MKLIEELLMGLIIIKLKNCYHPVCFLQC